MPVASPDNTLVTIGSSPPTLTSIGYSVSFPPYFYYIIASTQPTNSRHIVTTSTPKQISPNNSSLAVKSGIGFLGLGVVVTYTPPGGVPSVSPNNIAHSVTSTLPGHVYTNDARSIVFSTQPATSASGVITSYYYPPEGDDILFNFWGAYTPPNGIIVTFNFSNSTPIMLSHQTVSVQSPLHSVGSGSPTVTPHIGLIPEAAINLIISSQPVLTNQRTVYADPGTAAVTSSSPTIMVHGGVTPEAAIVSVTDSTPTLSNQLTIYPNSAVQAVTTTTPILHYGLRLFPVSPKHLVISTSPSLYTLNGTTVPIMPGIFNFCPNSMVVENLPPEPTSIVTLNGWSFSAKPSVPYQKKFKVTLHGVRWFLQSNGLYDTTSNPTLNARLLEVFYEQNQAWNSFTFSHPHLGVLNCRFAAPVIIPKGIEGGTGWIEPIEVTLLHHDPGY